MRFAEFVEYNTTECRMCIFFKSNPDIEKDIDGVLENGKPPKHFSLISKFLEKNYGQSFSVDYVQKHYDRHKEKA
jgi:hypothetical protein